MAAFDFPSSPSVNQTYTANGVTWKWNGTMWMRVSGAGYLEKIEEGNSKIEVDDSGSGNITATTDGSEKVRITSAGLMGLGTQSPSSLLTLRQTTADHRIVEISRPNTDVGCLYLGNDSNLNALISSNNSELIFGKDYSGTFSEFARIDNNGLVGIGTDNPTETLTLNDANGASIGLEYSGTENGTINVNSAAMYVRAGSGKHLILGSDGAESLRLTSAGNVNINGTPPWSVTGGNYRNLSISGNDASSSGFLWLGNGAAATNADFDLGRVNFVNGANIVAQIKGTTQTSANDDGRISFLTKSTGSNITERLRITSDGKIGFNAANPPRDYCFHSGQADTNIQITNNTTGIDDSAGALIQQDGNDFYIWNKENSFMSLGTNAAERLRITSSGYVGINNNTPPVRLAIQDTTNCKLLLSSSWSGTQEIIFGGGSASSTGAGNNTAAKIIAQASAPGGAATGYLSFYTNTGDNIYERLRLTPEGNIWTVNSSIMHGSGDVTNFANAGRTSNNNVSIRAGSPNAGTTPTNSNSAIKIYPAGTRSTTTGNLTGGIAWQHLDPDNGSWDSNYGPGAQIWMGASLHDTPGQERDRFNLWMNSGTATGSQPNNLAIEAYPNGVVRHPKVPAFMVRNSTNSGAFSAEARATWNVTILNNGSHFDMTNNVFTAPVDGIYNFSCMMLSQNNTRLFHNFRVNNTIIEGTRSESYSGTSYQTNTITMTYQLSANDYVDVYVRNNSGYGGNYTNFNGFLVG